MRRLFTSAFIILVSHAVFADGVRDTPHAQKTLEIYRKVISIPTVAGRGKVLALANYLASELGKAGFAKDDIHIRINGGTHEYSALPNSRHA